MIRSYTSSTQECGVVLKLKRFSHLSSRSFGLDFPIALSLSDQSFRLGSPIVLKALDESKTHLFLSSFFKYISGLKILFNVKL